MLAVLELKKRNSPPLLSSPLNDAQLMSFFREFVAKKAAWAFARANLDLRAPAKKRKRSLEGHVKSNQRDRDRAQRRQAAKGQKGQTGWAGKGEGEKGEYSYWR